MSNPPTGEGTIVVCGLGGLGLRTLEELRRLDAPTVAVARDPRPEHVARARQLGTRIVVGDPTDEAILRMAGVADALPSS